MTEHFVLAHGFTQTSRSWATIEGLLPAQVAGASTCAVDMPGHGSATRLRRDLWGASDHLVDVGGTGAYVGYSMGGRVALHAALRHPDHVRRLVLIGATAGIEDAGERAERRVADGELADRIMRHSIAAFIDEWLQNPLFGGLTEETAGRDDRLSNTRAGLASSLRLCGTGVQQPLWDRLDDIRCPTLVLVGEHDQKFRALGTRLADGIGRAELAVIPDAGHSVHLEQPAATVDAIADFVRRAGAIG